MKTIAISHQALRYTISAAVIIEGLDKFFNVLIEWKIYLAPVIDELWPLSAEAFLYVLGVAEISVGIIFLLHRRLGGLLVAGLMAGIIINLLLLGEFLNMILVNVVVGVAALHCGEEI